MRQQGILNEFVGIFQDTLLTHHICIKLDLNIFKSIENKTNVKNIRQQEIVGLFILVCACKQTRQKLKSLIRQQINVLQGNLHASDPGYEQALRSLLDYFIPKVHQRVMNKLGNPFPFKNEKFIQFLQDIQVFMKNKNNKFAQCQNLGQFIHLFSQILSIHNSNRIIKSYTMNFYETDVNGDQKIGVEECLNHEKKSNGIYYLIFKTKEHAAIDQEVFSLKQTSSVLGGKNQQPKLLDCIGNIPAESDEESIQQGSQILQVDGKSFHDSNSSSIRSDDSDEDMTQKVSKAPDFQRNSIQKSENDKASCSFDLNDFLLLIKEDLNKLKQKSKSKQTKNDIDQQYWTLDVENSAKFEKDRQLNLQIKVRKNVKGSEESQVGEDGKDIGYQKKKQKSKIIFTSSTSSYYFQPIQIDQK